MPSRTDSKGLPSSSADVGLGPMLPTCEPFRVQLHSPAGLTSVEKTNRKESMPVPGGVAKKRNLGGAVKLLIWEPWKRHAESSLAARETTNIVHPWVKIKGYSHFHLCLSHRLLIARLLPSIQGWSAVSLVFRV